MRLSVGIDFGQISTQFVHKKQLSKIDFTSLSNSKLPFWYSPKRAIKPRGEVTSSELKQKALYNIGNSYVQLNKLRKAVKSYQEALKFGENPKIRENLEWVKNKLRKEE